MRLKPYFPLLVLLGLVALYAQLTALRAHPQTEGRENSPLRVADETVRDKTAREAMKVPEEAKIPEVGGLLREEQTVALDDSQLELVVPEEGVRILEQANGSTLLHIDMQGRERLLVSAHFSAPSKGWSLNLGDSITNNGWGGDASTNFHDAEIQILDGRFEVYASDAVGSQPPFDGGKRFLKSWPNVAFEPGTVRFEVADGEVRLYDQTGQSEDFRHDALFALNGQPDGNRAANYDLYLGVNRVVSPGRGGSGISKLELSFR